VLKGFVVACVPSFTDSLCLSLCLFVTEEIKRKGKVSQSSSRKKKEGTITTPKQLVLKFCFFFFLKSVDLVVGFSFGATWLGFHTVNDNLCRF
jgi:hypothetical protein